jgi:hypothetical protein
LTFAQYSPYALAVSKAGNTVVIAASVIAAIRLARTETLGSSPKVHITIAESLSLAHRIYQKAKEEYPSLFEEASVR